MEKKRDIPQGWAKALLPDVAEINPRLDKSLFSDELQVSFVPMPAVETETGKINVSEIKKFGTVKKGFTHFQERDVLFAKITPCMENGKMAIVPKLTGDLGFGSTEFHVLRSREEIEPEYIYYFISSQAYRYDAEHNMTGAVGQRRVPTRYLETSSMPLPPTNEQKRIVGKIEELFSELDKGIESLKTARAQLKIYRQAVLKHAFEGKLTKDWREENKDKLEPADELLKRVKSEREEHSTKIKSKRIKTPRNFDDEDFSWLPELPESWVWNRLGWTTFGVGYGTSAKSAKTGKMPVLRMGNIQNAKFDWNDLVFTSDADEIKKYELRPDDVLFNRTNSPELVGKTAIYRGEQPALFAGYLIRVNQIESLVNAQFLNLFLNSHVAKQHGNRVKTDGVNQSNINGEKLTNYPFPYCSLEEQKIIVEILDKTISKIDQMEDDVDIQLKKSEALRQSILKKAFSGKLVAQDPADEPASVLLERIKAEKQKPTKKRKAA